VSVSLRAALGLNRQRREPGLGPRLKAVLRPGRWLGLRRRLAMKVELQLSLSGSLSLSCSLGASLRLSPSPSLSAGLGLSPSLRTSLRLRVTQSLGLSPGLTRLQREPGLGDSLKLGLGAGGGLWLAFGVPLKMRLQLGLERTLGQCSCLWAARWLRAVCALTREIDSRLHAPQYLELA